MTWSDPALQADAFVALALFAGLMISLAGVGWLVEKIMGVER